MRGIKNKALKTAWFSFLLMFWVIIPRSYADFRYYEAAIHQAEWRMTGNPIRCELAHEIPNYGTATFSSQASKKSNLAFHLHISRNLPEVEGQAVLRAQAPAWRLGVRSKELGKVMIESGEKPIHLEEGIAWRLLTELERGMFPTFNYSGWIDGSDTVSVGLSSVNFASIYAEFLGCLDNLLPYTFEDIANMTIHFDFDKHTFNRKAQAQLDKIKAYLQADPVVDFSLVVGHTDSRGGRWYNRKLGERRAEAVKQFLIDSGVEPDRIKLVSHGERKPVATNRTPEGRAKNRRVTLKLMR